MLKYQNLTYVVLNFEEALYFGSMSNEFKKTKFGFQQVTH